MLFKVLYLTVTIIYLSRAFVILMSRLILSDKMYVFLDVFGDTGEAELLLAINQK